MRIKHLIYIALSLSLFAWLIDIREFNGDILLGLFEFLMMAVLLFIPMLLGYGIVSLVTRPRRR